MGVIDHEKFIETFDEEWEWITVKGDKKIMIDLTDKGEKVVVIPYIMYDEGEKLITIPYTLYEKIMGKLKEMQKENERMKKQLKS